MKYIDLHCDTLTAIENEDDFLKYDGHISLEKLKKSGCLALCFAIFSAGDTPDKDFLYLKEKARLFNKITEKFSSVLSPAKTKDDIFKNERAGKISAILTAENGNFIGNDLSRIAYAANLGVKIITLTWNNRNTLGYPCSDSPLQNALGLTRLGVLAIEAMNSNNIIIDVSHLNWGGFWDVASFSNKPFCATHSCCAALYPHRRNLTDSQIKAVAKSGGVVGINFYNEFINGGVRPTAADDIVAQAEKIASVAGIDTPALGSDFDGMDGELEFTDCLGLIQIAEALNTKFTAEQVDKILYRNALRLLNN